MELLRRAFGRPKTEKSELVSSSPKSPFVETYEMRDYLDEDGFWRELSLIAGGLDSARDGLRDLPPVVAKTRKELRDFNKWQRERSKTREAINFSAELDTDYELLVERAKAGGEPVTKEDFYTYHSLQAGGALTVLKLLASQRLYAQKNGFESRLGPYLGLQEFSFTSGEGLIRINGVTFKDFMEEKPTLPEGYEFLMQSFLIRRRVSHEKVRKANSGDPLLDTYPNKTKHTIEVLTGHVQALINISPELVGSFTNSRQGIALEMAQQTQKAYQKIDSFRERFRQALLKPSKPEFASVKSALEQYLTEGAYERTVALFVAGLREAPHVYELYRKAKELSINGLETAFYKLLADSIFDYATELPVEGGILTIEDSPAVFDEGDFSDASGREALEMDLLNNTVSSIFSKTSNGEYDINLQAVDWGNLTQPQTAKVEFNPNRPQKFQVVLSYDNEVGESLELRFSFDLKKKSLDWNFIESPEDPRMTRLYRVALSVSQNILLQIQEKVERDYEEKQEQRRAKSEPTPVSKKRKKTRGPRDEVYEMRGKTRREAKALMDEGDPVLPDIIPIREGVKNEILVPEEALGEKLKNLASVDRDTAREGIERFNNEGVGEFKRKRRKGREGDILYTLRINCSVPGGMRVLMRETSSGDGVRRFEILDIRYRRDTYRRAGI